MSTQKSEGSENAPNAPYIAKRNLAARTGPNAKVKPHVNEQEYAAMYKESIEQPDKFWDKVSFLCCVCGGEFADLVRNRWPKRLCLGQSLTRLSSMARSPMVT